MHESPYDEFYLYNHLLTCLKQAPSDRAALEDLHNLWALGSKTPGLVSPVACPSPSPTPQQEEEMQQQQQQQQLASRPLSPLHSPGEVNEGSFLVP